MKTFQDLEDSTETTIDSTENASSTDLVAAAQASKPTRTTRSTAKSTNNAAKAKGPAMTAKTTKSQVTATEASGAKKQAELATSMSGQGTSTSTTWEIDMTTTFNRRNITITDVFEDEVRITYSDGKIELVSKEVLALPVGTKGFWNKKGHLRVAAGTEIIVTGQTKKKVRVSQTGNGRTELLDPKHFKRA